MNAYDITPIDLGGHLFQVTLTIEAPAKEQELWLPNWIPGSYLIRDFSKHIIRLYAECDGEQMEVRQVTKNRWRVTTPAKPITVQYQVYAWDLSVRSAYLDQQQGFFNNTSMCLAIEGQTDLPCELHLHAPPQAPDWIVATGMPRINGQEHSWGTFAANNYDELIDYPFLMGDLTIEEFIAHGIKHALVLSGRHYADTARITADLARICETQIRLFEEAPFQSYTFLTLVTDNGFGGLEHRNSTALMCSRSALINAQQHDMNDEYENFLSLCCHEYFHSWNIKTLKPRVFLPYSLEQECYTEQLWFYEGMTSYFDDYLLHVSGIIDDRRYLTLLGNTLARVERGVGQKTQSVAESSYLAWTKFYQQNENAPNSIVSYYAKGALIALSLDLMLRLQSDHKLTLARVMRDLWHEFGKTGIGTADDTVLSWLNHYPGIDVGDFLKDALYQAESLNVSNLLAQFGVRVEQQVPADDNHSGGAATEKPPKVTLGARYKSCPLGLEVTTVYHNESAHRAGLSAGDKIIALDGLHTTPQSIRALMSVYAPGDSTTVHAFRRDELLTFQLTWLEPVKSSYVLTVNEPEQLNGWLTHR